MDNMCNDLLLEIFSYLPMKEQIRCSQVSHRWRDIFQYSPIFSLKICKRQDKIDQLQSEFHSHHKFKCNNHLHNFNNLNIIYYDNFNELNLIIKNLLPQLKRLKSLHFEVYSLYELVEANLDTIIDLELEHFEIVYTSNMYIEGRIERLLPKLGKKLTHLIIEPKLFTATPFFCSAADNRRQTSYFGRVGLELIETYLPNLEQLHFEPLTFVIESLHPISLPSKLKNLSLPKVRMSITELNSFDKRNCSNLNELHFFDANIPILKIICNMRNLKKCVLGKIRINQANDLHFLLNLNKLEYLQFELNNKNIDEMLSELMQKLTKIRHLCLINCNLSNSIIKDMTNFWPKLTYLECHSKFYNHNITDEVLDHLSGLDTLKSLALPFSSITNKSLINYIEKSKINSLDVSYCMSLNEQIIHSMINKALKNPLSKYYLIILGHKCYIKENQCKNISIVLD